MTLDYRTNISRNLKFVPTEMLKGISFRDSIKCEKLRLEPQFFLQKSTNVSKFRVLYVLFDYRIKFLQTFL